MPPRQVNFDPASPLHNEKHERFARLRAILTPKLQAAREAGFETMTPGNTAKLDRRPDIRARVAALCEVDEEILRMKRERLEQRLNLVAYGNILQFATIDQETGEITAIDWRKVAESDLAVIISDFSFDPKTGRLTKFERDNALNAINQLRELHGFKAPAVQKSEHSFVGHGDKLDAALARLTHDDQKILAAALAEIEGPSENGGVESK
jgi:hypothetical protein